MRLNKAGKVVGGQISGPCNAVQFKQESHIQICVLGTFPP